MRSFLPTVVLGLALAPISPVSPLISVAKAAAPATPTAAPTAKAPAPVALYDVVYTHANLWTPIHLEDDASIAVKNGKIVDVIIDNKAEDTARNNATSVVDLGGRIVVPGMIDSHIHFMTGGINLDLVSLNSAKSVDEILSRIKAYATKYPERPWITGRGWQYDLFVKDKPPYPNRQMLDAIVSDRPIFVRAYDGHTGWANSKAMELAGITADTKDPKGGKILREKDGKTPSGIFLEEAMMLIMDKIPKTTLAERRAGILAAQDLAMKNGLVAVNEFAADIDVAEAYLSLENEGKLQVDVYFSPPLETPLDQVIALREKLKDKKKLHMGSLKGFADGVIESGTAAMIKPYENSHTHEKGTLQLTRADLDKYIVPADKAGFTVSVHAIGDLAVRTTLDAYENAAKVNGTTDRRHRIEHIEVIDPKDVPRFAKLGVIPSMQPFHCLPPDVPGENAWEKNLGKKRLAHSFAWRELLDAKAKLAFGSDWAVMSLDPMYGLAVASGRVNGRGLPRKGWAEHQRITFAEALTAYTETAAYGLHAESSLGVIAKDRGATFVVLSDKIDVTEPLSIYWGSVDMTVIDGKTVFVRK